MPRSDGASGFVVSGSGVSAFSGSDAGGSGVSELNEAEGVEFASCEVGRRYFFTADIGRAPTIMTVSPVFGASLNRGFVAAIRAYFSRAVSLLAVGAAALRVADERGAACLRVIACGSCLTSSAEPSRSVTVGPSPRRTGLYGVKRVRC